MTKKLFCRRGETLTEVLVSVLIIAISAAMLATMVTAAVNINIKTNTAVTAFYQELSDAERGPISDLGIVEIDGEAVPVTYYGQGETSLATYEKSHEKRD